MVPAVVELSNRGKVRFGDCSHNSGTSSKIHPLLVIRIQSRLNIHNIHGLVITRSLLDNHIHANTVTK